MIFPCPLVRGHNERFLPPDGGCLTSRQQEGEAREAQHEARDAQHGHNPEIPEADLLGLGTDTPMG